MRDYGIDFRNIFSQFITRPGADALLRWLESTDFFTAPASTRFHGSHIGGLCEHSVLVYERLKQLIEFYPSENKPSDETIAIVALLHDMCKVNFYETEFRNRKNERGEWEKYPVYIVDDNLCMGHGESSLYIVSSFMALSREEAAAINWHMGFGDVRFKDKDYTVGKAFARYPLALLLHTADSMATAFDESN